MMNRAQRALIAAALSLLMVAGFLIPTPPAQAQAVEPVGLILNEWNAVSSINTILNGDTYWGSVVGNGGDWFEMVVVDDNLDVRGWQLEISDTDAGVLAVTDTFTFADDPLLANLRAGTIITVSERLADDVSFDPASGDYWINLQANGLDEGAYFTPASQSNFNTNNEEWQLRVLDGSGAVRFGPAGEGVAGVTGVGSSEIGELEADPSNTITSASGYDDGDESTFGSPNNFNGAAQDFSPLRSWYGGPDTTAPASTLLSPSNGEVVTSDPVTITGETTDDVGVERVRVAILDKATNAWLQADGTFGAARVFINATLANPGAATTAWSLDTSLPPSDYRLIARANDAAGNTESALRSNFTVEVAVDDDVAPVTSIATPADDATVAGPVVSITGSTTDNVDVDAVELAIRDKATGLFLQADGTFAAARAFLTADLTSPGAATTDWVLSAPLPDANYRLIVRAKDRSGNTETPLRQDVTVETAPGDSVAPTSTITSSKDQAVGAVVLEGAAADNVAVDTVRVTVRNRDTGEYVQADGTLAANFHAFDAVLDAPGSPSTGWSVSTNLAVAGRYRLIAKAIDSSGNAQSPTTAINLVSA